MNRRRRMAGMSQGGGGGVAYSISGIVYDADGSTPVSGATVALGALSATSAANGTYTIANIPAGTSGSLTCAKTGYSWTAITIAAMSGNLTSQNYTNAWWAALGSGAALGAVWSPEGAVSLDASYNRIAGDQGNVDIDPAVVGGVAPTWSTVNGWGFNGSAQFLKSGVIPPNDQSWSFYIKFADVEDAGYKYICGSYETTASFSLIPAGTGANNIIYKNGGVSQIATKLLTGSLGFAGNVAYRNGAPEAGIISTAAGNFLEIYFGGLNAIGSFGFGSACKIKKVAFYKAILTSQKYAAVHAAANP